MTAREQRVPAWVPWAHAVATTALLAAAILRAPSDIWDLPLLAVLAALAIGSDLFAVDTDSRLRISGNSLALVLAAVPLGPTPAALLGLATIAVGWFKWREGAHYLRNNLVAFAAFPFLSGLGVQTAVSAAGLTPQDAGFYALVLPTYFVSVGLNFVLVAGYKCLLDGSSLWNEARRTFLLLLTSEMLCAVLTADIAWLAEQVGVLGLAFVTVALIAFQHVVGQLLVSRERGEQLRIQSVTDPLTGLPNRLGFTQQTDAALASATDRGERLGVMLMDLDRFKDINDTLGHHIGDLILAEVGARVRSAI